MKSNIEIKSNFFVYIIKTRIPMAGVFSLSLRPNLYILKVVFLHEIHSLNRKSLVRKSKCIISFCIAFKKQKFFIGYFEWHFFSVDFYFVKCHFVCINSDSIQKLIYHKTIFHISPHILFDRVDLERGKALCKINFRMLLCKAGKTPKQE